MPTPIVYLFKAIRLILSPILLGIDKLTSPQSIERSSAEQQKIDQLTTNLALYQYQSCPFCIKVRRSIKRLSLNIELCDVKNNIYFKEELISQGGKIQVPCLKIRDDNNQITWLYESSLINDYLSSKFS